MAKRKLKRKRAAVALREMDWQLYASFPRTAAYEIVYWERTRKPQPPAKAGRAHGKAKA